MRDGRAASFVLLDCWAGENELHHHVYGAPSDRPSPGQYATPTGLTSCVWDLRVLCSERQAWIDAVLANPAGPNLEAHLWRV